MALLTDDAKKTFKPALNFFAALVIVLVMVTLTCNLVIESWPAYIAWLKALSDFIVILGAIILGLIVADRNKLVK
jgi:cytochrome c biogenesis protein CcdA